MFEEGGSLPEKEQTEQGNGSSVHGNICLKKVDSKREYLLIIYRIPKNVALVITHVRAHNEDCGFMRTYIPRYIGTEKN